MMLFSSPKLVCSAYTFRPPRPASYSVGTPKKIFSLGLEWLENEARHSYPSSSRIKNKNCEITSPFHIV